MSIKNTIALVTGGGRGLGRDIALQIAEQGGDVVITYRSGEAEAAEVVERINALGRTAVALQLEVADSASFDKFAERLHEQLDTVWSRSTFDFLVNNAGIGIYAGIAETTAEQLDTVYDIHLKGVFLLTQTLVPLIADGGRIVNVSSGLTRFSFPGYAAYAAMKGAVEVFTRYLAAELGSRGITANVIAPGAIETDFGGGAVRDNTELNALIAGQTALGRVGLPDDIGGAVASLLSPANRWVNGQRIEISGGMLL